MSDQMSLWTGRTDPEDGFAGRRWHQMVRPWEAGAAGPEQQHIVFIGFASDEGVRRNQGRPGAAGGPAAIRRAASSLPDHFPEDVRLWDAGDVRTEGGRLEEAQEELSEKVASVIRAGGFPVVLGGGHEVAWGTYGGLRRAVTRNATIGLINLDAHFDLREPAGSSTSGTPFYQIGADCRAAGTPFRYLCLGIQPAGNTRALFRRAEDWGVIYPAAEALETGDMTPVFQIIDNFMASVDRIYLSIDLDVFAAAAAPGVSAVNPLGITPRTALALIRRVMNSGRVGAADIAELNPEYDLDGRTAKLAAWLLFHLLPHD